MFQDISTRLLVQQFFLTGVPQITYTDMPKRLEVEVDAQKTLGSEELSNVVCQSPEIERAWGCNIVEHEAV